MDTDVTVVHRIEDDAELKSCKNPSFLLANKKGGFFSLASEQNISRYQGCYFLKQTSLINWKLFKVVEDIRLSGMTPTHLINNFCSVERWYDKAIEKFYLHEDSFFYQLNKYTGFIDLILDCREMYDFDDRGRIYSIYRKGDFLVVEYKKFADDSLAKEQYKIYLVIKGCWKYDILNQWIPKTYEYDSKRGTLPKELYVYKALRIPVQQTISLIFSYGYNLQKAMEKADDMDLNCRKHMDIDKERLKTISKLPNELIDEKIKLAYKCCVNSLDRLNVRIGDNRGIFAGYPWFTQFWTRDEAISAGAYINKENFLDAKMLLFNQLGNLGKDGRIPSRLPPTGLASADGTGWCFKRINDLMDFTQHMLQYRQFFSQNDLEYIKEKLRKSIVEHLKQFTKQGLAYNNRLETWMDTNISENNDDQIYGKDDREGFRIEIQALRLKMYSLMKELCDLTKDREKYLEYQKLEEDTRRKVKKIFWEQPILIDGVDNDGKEDRTIRPNIFIAYYVYPELLNEKEWDDCFEHALRRLWLDWGGISTIDKKDKLFCSEYTGENNRSYHRGDSWFWLNCLAAICMHRLDKRLGKTIGFTNEKKIGKYKIVVDKIIDACCEEILFKGFVGHHAELSSAKELRAEGCLCQAWSAAMFIELINEVYFKHLKEF